MSDEEKKALKIVKCITEDDLLNYWEGSEEPYNAIQTVLNLIEKQSKEIEDNKKYIVQLTDEQYRKLVDIIRTEISKEWEDKIKAKIEELERQEKEEPDAFLCKKVLQSLLEKE